MDKLRALVEMCEDDDSELCQAARSVSMAQQQEEMLSAEDIRECAEEVSRAYRSIKLPKMKDEWKSSDDFDWGSDDEVESRVSMYRVSA